MTNTELAHKIAEALFTNWQGMRVFRLVQEEGVHFDGAGWGFKPAINVIKKIIDQETGQE